MTAAAQKRNLGSGAPNPARKALNSASVGFWAILLTSVFTNMLLLVSPIFMLQVYDRVIPSQSEPTLYALMGIAIGLIALLAMLEAARSRIEDTDYAAETSELARTQIIHQAGVAMLAQANQVTATVLALLR